MKFIIGRSQRLLWYLILLHGCILTGLMLTSGSWPLRVLLMSVVLLSFLHYCRTFQWLKSSKTLISLSLTKKGAVYLGYADNSQSGPLNIASSVVFRFGVILYLKYPDKRKQKSVLIMSDACDRQLLRQLKISLRDPAFWVR